jgi:ABC-type transport system involved in cytochrome bd biosynthesis fused ATPase/permease subunit
MEPLDASGTGQGKAPKVIAIMGATGAGKSSFIKLVTESSNVKIGHGLTSGQSQRDQIHQRDTIPENVRDYADLD